MTVYCDCIECPYNNPNKDYTCQKDEVYMDEGDCVFRKDNFVDKLIEPTNVLRETVLCYTIRRK